MCAKKSPYGNMSRNGHALPHRNIALAAPHHHSHIITTAFVSGLCVGANGLKWVAPVVSDNAVGASGCRHQKRAVRPAPVWLEAIKCKIRCSVG